MRLLSAHQIDVLHPLLGWTRQGRGPDQTHGADPQEIYRRDRRDIIDSWEIFQILSSAPRVAAFVSIDSNSVTLEINNVGCSGTVDIRQTKTFMIKLVGRIEPGRVVHRHFGAKATVT